MYTVEVCEHSKLRILCELLLLFDSISSAVLLFKLFEVREYSKFTNNRAIKVGSATRHETFKLHRTACSFELAFLHDATAVQEILVWQALREASVF